VFDLEVEAVAGLVDVTATSNRGLSIEEVADMAVNKILYVAEDAPPPLRDQALDFKDVVRRVIVGYLRIAVDQDRATVCAKLRSAGYPELADNLRSL
jgi:hypothetical protein